MSHAYGVFTSVCAIYFFDHHLDFKIMFGAHDYYTKLNKKLAILFVVLSAILMLVLWKLYLLKWEYYVGAIGLLLYAVLYFYKIPVIRFFKECIIALTAAWVVSIKSDESLDYGTAIAMAVLFFQNVVLYSCLEKEIDEYWGFRSSFNSNFYTIKKYTLITIQLLAFITIGFLLLFNPMKFGIAYVSFTYLGLSLFTENSHVKKHYRFLFDAVLLGIFIP